MKKQSSLIAVALGLFLGLPGSLAAQPDTVTPTVRALIAKKEYSGAIREALAAATAPDIKEADRFKYFSLAADATHRRTGPLDESLIALYQAAAADTNLSNLARLELLNLLSSCLLSFQDGQELRFMDPVPAREPLNQGLQIPGLLPAEQAVALINIGKGWEREENGEKAREAYSQILALDISETSKRQAHNAIAQSWAREGNREEALQYARQHELDMVAIYQSLGDVAGQTAALRAVIDDDMRPENERWLAFTRLPQFVYNDVLLLDEAIVLGQQYFPAFQAVDPNRAEFFRLKFRLRKLTGGGPLGANNLAAARFLAWSGPLLLATSRLSAADYDLVRFKTSNALAVLGQKEKFLADIREIAGDEKVLPKTRLWARLLATVVVQDTKVGLTPILTSILHEPNTNEDRVWAANEVARTTGYLGETLLQEAVWQAGDALFAKRETARVVSRYLSAAPANVTSWLGSPLLHEGAGRGVLDKKYGDNIQFVLTTDVTGGGRTAGGDSTGPGELATELYSACDERGLFLFLKAHDPRYRDVLEKLAAGGSIEIYMAPGQRQPYYFMNPALPEGHSDPTAFITNYPGEHFRLPSQEKGTYFSVAEPIDGGFGVVIFLAWELFADKLPENGTRWQLEAIRWGRNGGYSFGGIESVHNRSRFGEIEFQGLDEKAIIAIKRRIVTGAVAQYRNVIQIHSSVGRWADSDLGDREFYHAVVVPEIEKFNPYAARVTADMTETDVEEIFNEAVPVWQNLEGRIAAARIQYLKDKLAR